MSAALSFQIGNSAALGNSSGDLLSTLTRTANQYIPNELQYPGISRCDMSSIDRLFAGTAVSLHAARPQLDNAYNLREQNAVSIGAVNLFTQRQWALIQHQLDNLMLQNSTESAGVTAALSAVHGFIKLSKAANVPAPNELCDDEGEIVLRWLSNEFAASACFLADGHIVAYALNMDNSRPPLKLDHLFRTSSDFSELYARISQFA